MILKFLFFSEVLRVRPQVKPCWVWQVGQVAICVGLQIYTRSISQYVDDTDKKYRVGLGLSCDVLHDTGSKPTLKQTELLAHNFLVVRIMSKYSPE